MKRGKAQTGIRSRLMRVQLLLVLPLIILIMLGILFFLNSQVTTELNNARSYALQTAASAFDTLYTRGLKLLQIPYTEDDILAILSAEPELDSGTPSSAGWGGGGVIYNALYPEVLFYEPNISAVTLVSEKSGRVFYSRQYPTRSVNGRNPHWSDLRRSEWYADTFAVDEPVVFPAADNELYIDGGITLSLSQRLLDVPGDRRVGVIRIDLALSTLYRGWADIAEDEADVFAVADHAGQLVYAGSTDFLAEYPLLSMCDAERWRQDYRVSRYTAPQSGFTFYYLANPAASTFNLWIIWGVPALFALLCGAYAALFISRSSRAITRPVLKLKSAMLQGQKKDLSARCEALDGEMGELSEAFNGLMSQMDALVGEVAATEQEKAKLAYEVLQSKLNPHFLYNTMNAVRWKADLLGAKEVADALESLVSLLRFTIKTTGDTVPFAVELGQLENYIQVMRVRYGSGIDVDYDIDEACMGYRCIKFLFQPIVENCFIHAFQSGAKSDKSIIIKAAAEAERIRVTVEDNGDGIDGGLLDGLLLSKTIKDKTLFDSIGIDNVHRRIQGLFGPEYGLVVESKPGEYTRVSATIPKIACAEPRGEDERDDGSAGG